MVIAFLSGDQRFDRLSGLVSTPRKKEAAVAPA